MTKVTGPAMSLSASGSLGKAITYQKRPSGHAVYPKNKPGGRQPFYWSHAQLTHMADHAAKVAAWKALNDRVKALWDLAARSAGRPMSGFNYYMSGGSIPPDLFYYFFFRPASDYFNLLSSGFSALDACSIEFWVNPVLDLERFLFSFYDNGLHIKRWSSNDRLMVYIPGTLAAAPKYFVFQSANNALPIGSWTHCVITKPAHALADDISALDVKIYINAVEASSLSYTDGHAIADAQNICVGKLDPTFGSSDDFMFEFRLWQGILNPSDIGAHHADIRSITTDGTPTMGPGDLKINWRVTADDNLTTVEDFSGNNKTATKESTTEPRLLSATRFD